MYKEVYFNTTKGLLNFLNNNNISKEDIIFLEKNNKSEFYLFHLIYNEEDEITYKSPTFRPPAQIR